MPITRWWGPLEKYKGPGGCEGLSSFSGEKKKKMYHGKNWRWLIK
jgi:hypothetical protein